MTHLAQSYHKHVSPFNVPFCIPISAVSAIDAADTAADVAATAAAVKLPRPIFGAKWNPIIWSSVGGLYHDPLRNPTATPY